MIAYSGRLSWSTTCEPAARALTQSWEVVPEARPAVLFLLAALLRAALRRVLAGEPVPQGLRAGFPHSYV